MAGKKQKNRWTSPSEVLLWLLFVALVFPAAFAGYAVGHYTSLGKPPKTVISTTTVGSTTMSTTIPTTTSTPETTTAATTTSSSGGNAAAGEEVFTSAGCAGCHTFEAAGASGTIGPNLDTAIAADAQADGDMDLDAFIRESITDPDAYHANGFGGGMPANGGASLTPTQLDDLVAFISANTQQ